MIRDLAPFTLRGMLWYQGESNIIASNDGVRYADKMQALVEYWRGLWHDKNLPFYQIQIAPASFYTARKTDHLPDGQSDCPRTWR